MWGVGHGASGPGSRVQGLGVNGVKMVLGFEVQGSGFGVWRLGLRVQGPRSKVEGLGFRV